MLRFLGWLLTTGLALLLVLAGVGWYLLRDPNQLKPELTALIESQTGVPVRIDGNLAWQLFPPLSLSAEGVSADHDGTRYELDRLRLDVDLRSVLANRDLDQWQVKALGVDNLKLITPTDTTHVEHLRLKDFAPNKLSPFDTALTYQSGEDEPLPLTARGELAWLPQQNQIELANTRFDTTMAAGLCEVDATIRDTNSPIDPEDALIPVSVWQGFDWQGDCLLDRLDLEGETFTTVRVELDNKDANSSTNVEIPQFFGGSAVARIDINAAHDPVVWRIEPDLHEVDSQALMSWLDQRLTWIAPLAYGGALTMTGNTEAELVSSISGKTRFDGGQGQIDLSMIKQPLLALATLFREGERIQKWPELWQYERMTGDWTISGKTHELDMALDNLTAAFNGEYDPITDALDMQVDIVFEDNPGMHSFDVNPLLIGIPIPLNCTGSLESPSCRVNADAARRIVATVLTEDQGGELRAKLDKKIDEEVPEEYRDAARGLLDLLGGSLKQRNKPDG